MKLLPRIVNTGAYDASLIHKNVLCSKNRRVSMYEIELVTENGGTTFINNDSYPIKKDNIVCAKPGQLRHSRLPYKCLYIHMLVEDEQLDAQLKALPDVFSPSAPQKYTDAFYAFISDFSSPSPDNDASLFKNLFLIISMMLSDVKKLNKSVGDSHGNMQVIKKALAFIDESFCEKITLDEIAAHVHMSKIYFHNMFIAAVGKTPHQYILGKRLLKAQQMIISSEHSLSETALACGFSSQSYLNYAFKREYGVSPLQYKKEMSLQWEHDSPT